jgi:polar amino acid transport system substrate-binding protein
MFERSRKNSALALEKGNEDLLVVINKVIADCKADGSFEKWVKDYSLKVLENSK